MVTEAVVCEAVVMEVMVAEMVVAKAVVPEEVVVEAVVAEAQITLQAPNCSCHSTLWRKPTDGVWSKAEALTMEDELAARQVVPGAVVLLQCTHWQSSGHSWLARD